MTCRSASIECYLDLLIRRQITILNSIIPDEEWGLPEQQVCMYDINVEVVSCISSCPISVIKTVGILHGILENGFMHSELLSCQTTASHRVSEIIFLFWWKASDWDTKPRILRVEIGKEAKEIELCDEAIYHDTHELTSFHSVK